MLLRAMLIAFATTSLAAAEDVATLAAQLTTPRGREAADQLAELGPAAKDAVPQLIVALHTTDAELRWRAAWALSRIGPEAAPAAPALVSIALQEQGMPRVAALAALRSIGAAATDAVLDPMLKAPASDRGPYADLLYDVPLTPRAVPALLSLLESGDVSERLDGFSLLTKMGPAAAEAAPVLVHRIGGYDDFPAPWNTLVAIGEGSVAPLRATAADETAEPDLRGTALAILARIGGTGAVAAKEILCRTEDWMVWSRFLRDVDRVGPDAAALVPVIAKRLAEGECEWGAAQALAAMGPEGEAILERFLFTGPCRRELAAQLGGVECSKTISWLLRLSDPSEPQDVRHAALWSFAGLRLDTEQSRRVAKLVEAGLAEDPVIACRVAGGLGPEGLPLVQQLKPFLESANPRVRVEAASALCRLGKGGDKEMSILGSVFENADPRLRDDAIRALAAAGPPAAANYEFLLAALKDKRPHVRAEAADGLVRMLPALRGNRQRVIDAVLDSRALVLVRSAISHIQDVPTLVDLLSVGEFGNYASDRLVALGPESWQALIAALDSPDNSTRCHAAYALLRIDTKRAGERAWRAGLGSIGWEFRLADVCRQQPGIAIPVLMKALASDDPAVRGSAAYLLGEINHREAAPALRNAVAHEFDEDARCRELWALATLLDTP